MRISTGMRRVRELHPFPPPFSSSLDLFWSHSAPGLAGISIYNQSHASVCLHPDQHCSASLPQHRLQSSGWEALALDLTCCWQTQQEQKPQTVKPIAFGNSEAFTFNWRTAFLAKTWNYLLSILLLLLFFSQINSNYTKERFIFCTSCLQTNLERKNDGNFKLSF